MSDDRDFADRNSQPLRVIISGGSIGSLCAGLALRPIGCQVRIFEQLPNVLQSPDAGSVVQLEMERFLSEHGLTTIETLSILSKKQQFLAIDGSIIWEEASPQVMISWDLLHHQLRKNFPHEFYHKGNKIVGFEQNDNCVKVCLEDWLSDECV